MATKRNNLMLCLLNDLRGIELEEHADLEGFVIRDAITKQALYTAYCAEEGYSSFIAVADNKGYELADEKPLVIKAPLFKAVSAIKTDHVQHGGPYPKWHEVSGAFQGGYWS